jgi:5'-3' exoribonuclease 2
LPSQETQVINSPTTISSNGQQNDRYYDGAKREISDSSISTRQEEITDPNDTVRLWEEGWHERYYKSKFNVDKDHLDNYRKQVVENYVQGVCWVLEYYYQGVPSWDWYLFM